MSHILGKTITSAAILWGLYVTVYIATIVYAQLQVGSEYQGISISEYSEPLQLLALHATSIGILVLLVTSAVWIARIVNSSSRIEFVQKRDAIITGSILGYPLLFASLFVVSVILYGNFIR